MMSEASSTPLIPVFDGHNDTLLSLLSTGRDFFTESEIGHIDLPRAQKGGLVGGFFAVFVPDPTGREPAHNKPELDGILGDNLDGVELMNDNGPTLAYAQLFAHAEVAALHRILNGNGTPYGSNTAQPNDSSNDPVSLVRTVQDVRSSIESNQFSSILHFEGAEMIDTNFYSLESFYQAGLRSLGIVWSRSNVFAHGVPFSFPASPDTGPGLTDAGKALVTACNELGVLLDVSHLNEAGFWDLAATTTKPIVATHSNAHALCPSTRNLTDKQLAAIRDSDGIVGVNFNVPFLRPDGGRESAMPLDVMADHVDYLVEKLGIDRVALGSDFDGALMPDDLSDASELPNLITLLRKRGYDDASLRKIGYQNWIRVLELTWEN
jgi:membrane dipeptidase